MKRILVLTVLTALLSVGTVYSAPGDALWSNTYGGGSYDYGECIQQTSDGGYIMTGYTYSYGVNEDLLLVKIDSSGNQEWYRNYGGSDEDRGFWVQQVADGGYIAVGYTLSFGAGYRDIYVVRTDSNGDSLWANTYGASSHDFGYCVQLTTDGGYILSGYTQSYGPSTQLYLVKIDANGNQQWENNYGGSSLEEVGFVQQTSDGGYVLVGNSRSHSSNWNAYMVKTNASGTMVWERWYDEYSYARNVVQTPDGGYALLGYKWDGNSNFYLVKTSSNGTSQWDRTYGGSNTEEGKTITLTPDGGYLLAGYTNTYGAGGEDIYLVKTAANGDTVWTKTHGGSSTERAYSIHTTDDGRYIVGGYTNSFGHGSYDFYAIKIDEDNVHYPAITNIVQNPDEPGINEDCEISATITDTSTTMSITLAELYYDNGSGYTSISMDNVADSFFATIPGQSGGTTVEYYIYAEDNFGDNATSDTFTFDVANHTIYEVQYQTDPGTGDDCYPSIHDGGVVTLSGIVTAVRQGTDHWFWLQDTADTLWNGLYVYDTTVDPEVGDSLTLSGTISEYFGVTELMDITESTVNSSSNAIITKNITTADIDSLCAFQAEQYEGMLVEFNDVTVIEGPSSHNECWVQDASGVPCIIDDELWKYGTNQPDPQPAAGMSYEKIAGVVHYSYGAYRVYPRGAEDYQVVDELLCGVTITTPFVPSNGGDLGFNIDVTNNTPSVIAELYGEIHPTIGDCVSGSQFDFDNYAVMTTDLGLGESFTGYYYMTMGNYSNLPNQVALAIEVGDGPNSYQCSDCGEFIFQHQWPPMGKATWSDVEWFELDGDVSLPTQTALFQNYPNPFNATTVIPFELSANGNVSMKVYNLAGQLVETLFDGYMYAGSHEVNWDASTVSSGVYFYTLETENYTTTKKMNLLK
ncbi:MAG: T9SS type A sorting domain-containing protein [candidate division Zixibacteria bacterium]|nr:T9SS type A sorting domain-containing protein [candidate division Zixibacteria bacterium]